MSVTTQNQELTLAFQSHTVGKGTEGGIPPTTILIQLLHALHLKPCRSGAMVLYSPLSLALTRMFIIWSIFGLVERIMRKQLVLDQNPFLIEWLR